MISNRIGRYLCYAVGLFGAVWAYFAVKDLYHYWRLSEQTRGHIQEAHVHELSTSSFDILATYTYVWKEQTFTRTSSLGKPYQLNPYSAEKTAHSIEGTWRDVYLNPAHPEISALTHVFPYKAIFQAVLTLGICLYLWILNLYYGRTNSERRKNHSLH